MSDDYDLPRPRNPRVLFLAAGCGLLAGLAMVLFRLTVGFGQTLILGSGHADHFEQLSPLGRLALASGGGLALGILFTLLPLGMRATGVAHVLERIAWHGARLPFANAAVQFIGAATCLICGHSVGREGLAIHIGASFGSLIAEHSALVLAERQLLVACGTAGAIAAAFNTPLAGVALALEVMLGERKLPNLTPVLLAAISATAVSQAAFGDIAVLSPRHLADFVPLQHVPGLLALGAGAGLVAVAFIRLLLRTSALSAALPVLPRLTLGGVLCGLIGMLCPQVMGLGYHTLLDVINGEYAAAAMALMLLAKLLATALGLGCGLPGGLIGPSLLLGALVGGIGGQLLPGALPGLYAVIGMGATMGATLNAPLAALTALLEIVRDPRIILPAMLAIAAADVISHRLFGLPSAFICLLRARGIDYPPPGRG